MKITSISYRALRTGRGYNNAAVEAHATLDSGDDPVKSLEELKFWVEKRLDASLALDDAYADLAFVRGRVEAAKRDAEHIERRNAAARDHERIVREVADGREIIAKHQKLARLAREHGLEAEAQALFAADGIPF